MASGWSRFTVAMGPLTVLVVAQLQPGAAHAQKTITGTGTTQVDLQQPASFGTYTVTGDPTSTLVNFVGTASVPLIDAVTDGGSANPYTLINSGTIHTTGAMAAGVSLSSAGTGSTVINHGLIVGGSNGDGIRIGGPGAVVRNQGNIQGGTNGVLLGLGGTVTNLSHAAIGASAGHGVTIVNQSGNVANAGTISGSLIGVLLDAGGNVANGSTDGGTTVTPGARIAGGIHGLWIGGSGGTVINHAGSTIEGNGNAGITIAGTSGTVDNRGAVNGMEDGIRLNNAGTVINSGVVRGATSSGILLANGGLVRNDAPTSDVQGNLHGVLLANGGTVAHLGGRIAAQAGNGVQASGGATIDSHATIQGAAIAVQFLTGNNTLALHAGSVTTGALRMGSGADRVTVFADADISGVPLYEGGTGSSTLTFDGYRGSVPGSIDPWTVVAATGGADVTLTSGTLYEAGLFRIDSGAALRFRGDSGTLTGDVGNQGTLSYASGAGAGAYQVTGTLTNGGLVELASATGSAGQTLTASNYAGTGGMLSVKSVLAGDGAASDRLIINGGTATGTTGVRVTNAGGEGALTTASGILVVDTANGGTTAPTAFTLDGRAVAGAYEYRLFRGSTDGSNPQAWYLRTEKSPQPAPPTPPTPPAPPAPPEPLYRPEIATYLANQRLVGQMFVHALHDRLGEPQYVEGQGFRPAPDQARSGWLRVAGKWEGSKSRDGNFKVSTDAFLLQGGVELARWNLASATDRLHLGAMGSYGNASSDANAATATPRAPKAACRAGAWAPTAPGTRTTRTSWARMSIPGSSTAGSITRSRATTFRRSSTTPTAGPSPARPAMPSPCAMAGWSSRRRRSSTSTTAPTTSPKPTARASAAPTPAA